MKYLGIQRLRCAAALVVVVYHLGCYAHLFLHFDTPLVELLRNPVLSSGVQLFFVISGFVLGHSLRTTSVRDFLAFRLLRIYPTYFLAVGLVVGLKWHLFRAQPLGRNALLAGLSLAPLGDHPGYYPLFVEWTLVYEVFFYVALALLALGGRRGVLVGTLAWLALLLAKCWLWPDYGTVMLPTWRQVGLSIHCVPFLFGVLIDFVHCSTLRFRPTLATLLLPIVPLLLMVSVMVSSYETTLIVRGLAFAVLVWAFAVEQTQQGNDWLVRLGDWSYGIYLLHVPVITISFIVAPKHGWAAQPYALLVAVGALAVTLGAWFGCAEVWLYGRLRQRYRLYFPSRRTTVAAHAPTSERRAA